MIIRTKNLDNYYVISDLHLLHKNIIKYCNRPFYKDLYDEKTNTWTSEPDIYKMGIHFLNEFNLPKGSVVINLGDLGMMEHNDLDYITKYTEFMGEDKKLWLVLGNHDLLKHPKKDRSKYKGKEETFYKKVIGFNKVSKNPLLIKELGVVLSHEPYNSDNKYFNIHGHTHDKSVQDLYEQEGIDYSKFYNVSCDVIDYKPMKLLDVLNILGIEIKTKFLHIKKIERRTY